MAKTEDRACASTSSFSVVMVVVVVESYYRLEID